MSSLYLAPQDVIIFPSAARTSRPTSPIITNPGYSGMNLYLNITAASGIGGLVPQMYYIDPVSGTTSLQGVFGVTARTATGLFVYTLYPASGLLTLNGGAAVIILPSNYQLTVSHGDASSYTYSVGIQLLP